MLASLAAAAADSHSAVQLYNLFAGSLATSGAVEFEKVVVIGNGMVCV